MNTPETIMVAAYTAWNVIVFFIYGIDKRRAKRGKWRISETALLLSAVLMGGVGALLGMRVFRHKTKHHKFIAGVPIAVALNIIVAIAVTYLLQQ